MKYLIFSDIHGNLDALEAVLEEAERIRPDIVVSLGDVVGYGANPNECIERVEDVAQIKIGGNHDLAASGLIKTDNFNYVAKAAIRWTIEALKADYQNILADYDTIRRHGDSLFTHATPVSPLDWEYIYTIGQAKEIFEKFGSRFIFIGHTHIPAIIKYRAGDCTVTGANRIEIKEGERYLINVGSVGQPRDGNTAASFAVLDEKKGIISIKRLPYDVRNAQDKIISAGLPEALAMRLVTAR
ncbi:MAG: hypothetical protein B6D63_05630 [Candidatus Latescibacteria bacterium 4484_7]|nr:MAG: hypothetical protein B6D63_05630 [Candidatus Latescibacteria bacterium 4484_7]